MVGYAIYRNNSLIATVEPNSHNYYDDIGLIDGVTYVYKVSAYDEVPNYGINSTAVSGVPQDTIPPPQVTGVNITVIASGNQLNLTWDASTASDIAGYAIYRSTSSGFTPSSSNNIINVSTNHYLDTGLTDGVTYYYKIRAYDEVPNTATPSTESSGTPQDTVPPDQVTGLTISVVATGNSLALSWTASSAGDIAGYRIYRSTTSGGPYIHVTDQITNSYTDTGLTDGVTYYYLISAYDEVPNYGVNSTEKSGIPSDSTPPPKVTDVLITVVPTGNKLNIEWTDLSGTVSDLVGYKIYRSTTPGFTPSSQNNIANVSYTKVFYVGGICVNE